QELKIDPMLGCFGVAPPRGQAISCATSGQYGGNMDYRGFTQGVTVYFPVFVPGALLHVGDGHAIQGDGEIVGTGIEISFDVQFTVQLLKGKAGPLTAEANGPSGALVDAGRLQLHCSDGQYTARLMALEPASQRISRVNRHFDHTQLFVPLTNDPMLLVVAPAHLSGEKF